MENLLLDVESLVKAKRHNEKTVGCVTTSEIAKMYKMPRKDFISFLRDIGVFMPKGRPFLTSKYRGMGLAMTRHCIHFSLEGELKDNEYLVWTPKGLDFIRSIIKK